MTIDRKYARYISEAKVEEGQYQPSGNKQTYSIFHYDNRNNEEAPHFIEVNMKVADQQGVGTGTNCDVNFPRSSYYHAITKAPPEKHPFYETFCFIGTDPDHPEELGGTHEYWLGEGEKAERYIIDKPTSIVVPPNMVHTPSLAREVRKPYLSITVLDSTWWAGIWVNNLPPPYDKNSKIEKDIQDKLAAKREYAKYLNEIHPGELASHPSYQGKVVPMLRFDRRNNDEAPHFVDCRMIIGDGVGFGTGDRTVFPSFPNKHPWYETISFIGLDPEHPEELGGTVEFWIGEGSEAEEYIINKPTTVLIPKNTVHLPIYFKETHNPFVILTILDSPLWAGRWIENFPKGFKHVSENVPDIPCVMP